MIVKKDSCKKGCLRKSLKRVFAILLAFEITFVGSGITSLAGVQRVEVDEEGSSTSQTNTTNTENVTEGQSTTEQVQEGELATEPAQGGQTTTEPTTEPVQGAQTTTEATPNNQDGTVPDQDNSTGTQTTLEGENVTDTTKTNGTDTQQSTNSDSLNVDLGSLLENSSNLTGLTESKQTDPDGITPDLGNEENAVDTISPTISLYEYVTENKEFKAEFSDEGSGLGAYAFTTSQDIDTESESWVALSGESSSSVTQNVSSFVAGDYYLHVKDKAGNIATSNKTLAIEEVEELPDNNEFTADNITFSQNISEEDSINGKYGDINKTLTVALDENEALTSLLQDDGATVSWKWIKNDGEAEIPGGSEQGTSLELKNVADSGTYKAVCTITVGEQDYTKESGTATITIEKRELNLKIDDKEISFLETPEYTVSVVSGGDGLADGDTLGSLYEGGYTDKLSCEYNPENAALSVTSYPITVAEGSSFDTDNYSVIVSNGELKVSSLEITEDMADLEFEEEGPYLYSDGGTEPVVSKVIVTIDSRQYELDSSNYGVSYSNNNTVGDEAVVTVTFKGILSGSISRNFSIIKGSYDVTATINPTSSEYGSAVTPETGVSNLKENAEITYKYLKVADGLTGQDALNAFEAADKSGASTNVPKNAGVYYLYAEIGETNNFSATISKPALYEITKRQITITASSGSWQYSGNPRTAEGYTQEGDFLEGEGFQAVSVVGSITDVGTADNVITYLLTSATNENNYEINAVNGTLEITAAPLPKMIDSLKWTNPGQLEWVAITRSGLSIEYEVRLYKDDDETPIKTYRTTATALNVRDDIIADSIANGVGAYSASINANILPDDAGMSNNYSDGPFSDKCGKKYTAKLSLSRYIDQQDIQDAGISSIGFENPDNAENDPDTIAYIIQGESKKALLTYSEGYENNDEVVFTNDGGLLTAGAYLAGGYTITYSSQATSAIDAAVALKSKDSSPECVKYSGSQADDYSYVQMEINITDKLGLYGYQIIETTATVSDISSLNVSDDWTIINYIDGRPATASIITKEIKKAGTYYLVYKDIGGNVCYSPTPVVVYEISFDAGEGTGTMPTIYKLKDSSVKLPENKFTKSGYVFTNWTAGQFILPDKASYVRNENVTLVAGWTNQKYSYTVKYFYQTVKLNAEGKAVKDAEGNTELEYSLEPDKTDTFTSSYSQEFKYNDLALQKEKEGYTLTDTPEGVENYENSIIVTEDGMSLSIYYALKQYTMSYSYKDPDGTTTTFTDKFYYGEPFVERDKPSYAGYDFIGWNYDDGMQAPEAMTAYNLSASGYFKAQTSSYIIRYYFQDLDISDGAKDNSYLAQSFSLNNSILGDEVVSADYGKPIWAYVSGAETSDEAEIVTAHEVPGFTAAAVVVSYQSSDVKPFTDFDAFITDNKSDKSKKVYSEVEGNVTAGAQRGPTYVSFYYTRSVYTLKMGVYKGARENNEYLYGSQWSFPYGYKFADSSADGQEDSTEYSINYSAAWFETYGYKSKGFETVGKKTFSTAWTENWPTDGVSRDKFYLAAFVDWSTGDRPSTMPAGDVSVVREYASQEQSVYVIDLYVEDIKASTRTYNGKTLNCYEAYYPDTPYLSYERYIESGKEVTISDNANIEESETLVALSTLMGGIEASEYYELDPDKHDSKEITQEIQENVREDDAVTVKPDTITHFKIYLSRKKYNATIRYVRRDYEQEDVTLAHYTISQKWGTTFNVDSSYYFDGSVKTAVSDNCSTKTLIENVTDAAIDNENSIINFSTNYVASISNRFYVPVKTMGNREGSHSGFVQYDAEDLETKDPYRSYMMGTSNTACTVYYTQQMGDLHYFVKFTCDTYPEEKNHLEKIVKPLTYVIDGTEYQICAANKSDIFDGDNVREEFEQITLTYKGTAYDTTASEDNPKTGNYYILKRTENDSLPLLFIAVEDNILFYGNMASVNYDNNIAAHVGREFFDAEKNQPDPSLGTPTRYNEGLGTINKKGASNPIKGVNGGTEDVYVTINCYFYEFEKEFYIQYQYNGSTRGRVEYPYNTVVPKEEITTTAFNPGEGFEILWFKDSQFTELVDDITVTGPNTVYGKRYNVPIENMDYAYYQLPDGSYYTGSLDAAGVTGESESVAVTYKMSDGIEVEREGTITSYYKDGYLVAKVSSNYSQSFSEFQMDYGKYVIEGFEYDDKNTNNKSKAFCGKDPVNMYGYYARTSALLTVRKNDSDTASNDDISLEVNGTTKKVEDPEKKGYTFKGWKMYDNTDSENPVELDSSTYQYKHVEASTSTKGYVTFRMPVCATLLAAQWEPAEIDFNIVHYFQDKNRNYRQTLFESVREASGESVSATIGTSSAQCQKFDVSGEIVLSAVDGNNTYFYISDDGEKADKSGLFAIVENIPGTKSEDVINVSDHDMYSSDDMFVFSRGTYQHNVDDSGNLTKSEDETGSFKAYYDAEVAFYYERDSSIYIYTADYSIDGSSTGVSLSGAGKYYYGQQVTLLATMQSDGYSFKGWYKVNSGEELTGEQIENLAELIAGNSDAFTKLSDNNTVTFTAKATERYIAVTEADPAIKPALNISVGRDLVNDPIYYNYASDSRNQFNALINWGQGVSAGANNIKRYVWYYYHPESMSEAEYENLDPEEVSIDEMTEIADSNSSTFNLPLGYDAGYYVLRCYADIERKDNGRTVTTYGSCKFIILPDKDYLKTTAIVGQKYTGNAYKYTETWVHKPESYKIYYSENAFTLGEDVSGRTDITETIPEYRDVCVDADHNPIPHKVYYYVVSQDHNYASLTGECSVELLPVYVTVRTVRPFTKIYDATTNIQGKPENGVGVVTYKADGTYSDFYRLQTGIESEGAEINPYYLISGILPTDQDKFMMLNFDATFDYLHASGSGIDEGTKVTLSNLGVLSSDSKTVLNNVYENWNYIFPTGQTLVLSGEIKPFPLDIKWVPTSENLSDPDVATKEYQDSEFSYNYTGSPLSPYITIITDRSLIPDKTDDFKVDVKNKQTNAGTWSAVPEVEVSEGAAYFPTDYTFTLDYKTYKILPRRIKVSPKDETVVYNGQKQTNSELVFETRESESDEYVNYELPEVELYTVTTSGSYKDVGEYTGIKAGNMVIYTLSDSGKKNVITDNYVIEYGTGTLTIEKCPVKIEGIKGVNKEYDGNTAGDLDVSNATVKLLDGSSLYAGDVLTIEALSGGKPGTFDTKDVGTGKEVTISYASLEGATKGIAIKNTGAYKNYSFSVADSQATTTADIVKNTVNVQITNKENTVVYGETILPDALDYSFTGFIKGADGEDDNDIVTEDNYPKFRLMKKDGAGYVNAVSDGHSFDKGSDLSFIKELDAGIYYVFFVESDGANHIVEGFTSEKYNVSWDYEHPVTLTVTKRPVSINGIVQATQEAPVVSKVYDANTSVDDNTVNTILGTQAAHPYYSFGAVAGNDASGVMDKDASALVISNVSGAYDDKNVPVTSESGSITGAQKVLLTGAVLGGDSAGNYMLQNDGFEVPGTITPKDLTVKIKNATVTYGSAFTDYEFELEGAVSGDEEALLIGLKDSSQTVIECDYEAVKSPVLPKSHDVGIYAMNISRTQHIDNTNYNEIFPTAEAVTGQEFGLLTVEKKEVTYKAKDVTINYGYENPPTIFDGEFAQGDFVYGESIATEKEDGSTARILGQGSADSIKVYTDEACETEAENYDVEFACEGVGNASAPGDYDINPANVESLYTKNYLIKADKGTLTISKFYIAVTGVKVGGKVYDNSKNISPEKIDISEALFTYYDGTQPHKDVPFADLSDDFKASFDVNDFTASYSDKNVGEGIPVTLGITIKPDSYADKRFILLTSSNLSEAKGFDSAGIFTEVTQTSANADITPKDLTLKPNDLTIKYGEAVSADNIVITGEGFADDDVLSATVIPGYTKPHVFTTPYTVGSDVGDYTIDISGTVTGRAGVHGNYNVSFDTGNLTVTRNKFPAPQNITWNGGKLTWSPVENIGNVEPIGYRIIVYKDGADEPVHTTDFGSGTTIDLTEVLTNSGKGNYTAKICAVAKEDNNEGYKNVEELGDEATSGNKFVVEVTPKYATDDVTVRGSSKKAEKTESFLVIAGDNNGHAVEYSWATESFDGQVTADGYGLGSIKALVNRGVTVLTSEDDSAHGSYKCNVFITDEVTDSSVDIVLALKKVQMEGRPDYLVLTVNDWKYGEERNEPQCTVLDGLVLGDITLHYKKKGTSAWITTLPTDAGEYEVYATSAETEDYKSITSVTKSYTISKNKLAKPQISFSNGRLSWETVTGYEENNGNTPASVVNPGYRVVVNFKPQLDNDQYGNSEVKADVVVNTDNYLDVLEYIDETGEYTFEVTAVAIDGNKTSVGSINCDDSETVKITKKYISAKVSVDYASKIYDGENTTLTAEFDDGSAQDTYHYKWFKEDEVVKEGDGAQNSFFTFDDVNESGTYSVEVTTEKTRADGIDAARSRGVEVNILKRPVTITAKDYSKEYDGTPLSVAGVYTSDNGLEDMYIVVYTDDSSKNALVDGNVISSLTLSGEITDKGEMDNMPLDVVILKDDASNNDNYDVTYTPGVLSITAKPASIKADDATFTYDGESHFYASWVSGSVEGLLDGHEVVSVEMTSDSVITDAGSTDNKIAKVIVKDGDRDVSDNYSFTPEKGTLQVDKADVSLDAEDIEEIYDGTAKLVRASADAIGSFDGIIRFAEVTEDDEGNEVVGPDSTALSFIHAGEHKIKVTLSESSNHNEAEPIYITVVINKRNITITADSATLTYDGTQLSNNSWTVTSGSLADGDTVKEDSIFAKADNEGGYVVDVGTYVNKMYGEAVILRGSAEVTDDYNISYVDGKIVVVKGETKPTPGANESTSGSSTGNESTSGSSTGNESTSGSSTGNESTSGSSTGNESTSGSSTENESTSGSSTGNESTSGSSTEAGTNGTTSNAGNSDNTRSSADGNTSKSEESANTSSTGGGEQAQQQDDGNTSSGNGALSGLTGNYQDTDVLKVTPLDTPSTDAGNSTVFEKAIGDLPDSGTVSDYPVVKGVTLDSESDGSGIIDYTKFIIGTIPDINEEQPKDTAKMGFLVESDSANVLDCRVENADIPEMMEQLLTEDEVKTVENGSNLRFRVKLTRIRDEIKNLIEKDVKSVLPENYEIIGQFDSSFFVQVGSAAERLIDENYESVEVAVKIPDDLWDDSMAGHSQIVRRYVSESGETVTEVVVSYIEDQNVVMSVDNYSNYYIATDSMILRARKCYIHYLIILMLLFSLISITHYYHKKKKAKEKAAKNNEEIDEDEWKKKKRMHYLFLILFSVIGAILVFFGFCKWDLIAEIATVLGSSVSEYIAYKRDEKKEEDDEIKENVG